MNIVVHRTMSPLLVQVPCDPKMLVAPLDPQQLAKFHLTTLERDPKRDLVLEPDLGIPLTVFDIGRYAVPVNPPPLAPEDQALLEVRVPDFSDLAASYFGAPHQASCCQRTNIFEGTKLQEVADICKWEMVASSMARIWACNHMSPMTACQRCDV